MRTVLPLVLTAVTLALAGQAAQGNETSEATQAAEALSIPDWQDTVRGAKEELLTIAREDSNFTGSRFDNAERELVTLLAGPPEDKLVDAMARLADTLPSSTQATEWSEAELAAAAQALMDVEGVHTAAFELDFSGVVAKTETRVPSARTLAATARVSTRLAEDEGTPPIPVRVVRTAPLFEVMDRGAGNSPFRGGSRINVPAGDCSTGFRIYQNGNGKMLTATHCFKGATQAGGAQGVITRQSGDLQQIGQSANALSSPYDVQAIDGQAYTDGTWVGEAPVSGAYTLNYPTAGTGELAQNEYVCVSGAWSGTNCGLTGDMWVNRTSCSLNQTNCVSRVGGIAIVDDQVIAGEGDSGSPAYQSLGSPYIAVAGLLVAGDANPQFARTCPAFNNGRLCSRRVIITPWFRFRTQFTPNLTLNP